MVSNSIEEKNRIVLMRTPPPPPNTRILVHHDGHGDILGSAPAPGAVFRALAENTG